VGVGEPIVGPCAPGGIEAPEVELALGDEHALRLAAALVAIDGDVGEAVVGADRLLLIDLAAQDVGVP
jgi:hypothetical protein